MLVPDSIKNAVVKSPLDNAFFYNADDMWERMTEIRKNEVKFRQYDMSTLANCVELYYKGFIRASGINVPESLMTESHSLVRLTEHIESQIMPLSGPLTKQEERDRRNFLFDLQSMYIDARYNRPDVDKKLFDACYDWGQKQIHLIKTTLVPEKENNFEIKREY